MTQMCVNLQLEINFIYVVQLGVFVCLAGVIARFTWLTIP